MGYFVGGSFALLFDYKLTLLLTWDFCLGDASNNIIA